MRAAKVEMWDRTCTEGVLQGWERVAEECLKVNGNGPWRMDVTMIL